MSNSVMPVQISEHYLPVVLFTGLEKTELSEMRYLTQIYSILGVGL